MTWSSQHSEVRASDAPTTADAVRDTYYGFPVIKQAHWGWLVVAYFFFGGLASGGFIISTIAQLVSNDRSIVRAGRYLSMGALIPSPVLLILDLGRPERFLNMFRIIKLSSPLSLGSWALAGMGIFASAATALQLLSDLTHDEILPGVQRAAGILGLPFALFVSGYTGVLLAVTNVPVWARNTTLLGPTFVASAFSTSFASLSLLLGLGKGERPQTAQRVARMEAICLTTELTLLLAGVARLGKLGRPLTARPLGAIFWPFTVGTGLLLPLILQLTGPAQGKSGSRLRRTITALLVLSGGVQLRALMIFAGRISANRPEDYFEYTKKP